MLVMVMVMAMVIEPRRDTHIVKWGKKRSGPYGGKKKRPLQLYDVVNHKNEYMC